MEAGDEMAQQVTTIRLSDDLRQRVDSLVDSTGRSMNYHIQRAVEEYVERQSWQIATVQRALEHARAGQGIDLTEYAERSMADGSVTREGYERALAEEFADAQAERA